MGDSKSKGTFKELVLVLIIIGGGAAGAAALILLKKPPVVKPRVVAAPLVNAEKVVLQDMQMTVKGFGTAEAKRTVAITPEVTGLVVKCSENFVRGGFFKAGEPLVVIDQRDYELAVQNAEAAVARTRVALEQEMAEAGVARREWDRLHPGVEPASGLVVREPQIKQAQAELLAANAQLERAKLDLERTVISMPFDGRVIEESGEVGKYVSPGQSIGTVYGTEVVEIVVPLDDRELEWFDVSMSAGGVDGQSGGSDVIVTADFAGREHEWSGRVVRTQGQIDAKSRMVHVVAEVEKPFDVSAGQAPLTPGMFVEVHIQGRDLKNVVRVPRYAVHNGNEVWVVNDEHLKITPVRIARQDKQYAYVTEGLEDGAVIITSPIDTVTDGMKVRVYIEGQAEDAAKAAEVAEE